VLKTALSIFVAWFINIEFVQQEIHIGQNNFKALQEMEFENVSSFDESKYSLIIDRAPWSLIQGLLLSVAVLIAESVNGFAILFALFFMQPITALITATYFISAALIQHSIISKMQVRVSSNQVEHGNRILDVISDVYHLRKLLKISGYESFEKSLKFHRMKFAESKARVNFFASLPRYFMEAMLAIGFLVIAGSSWLLNGYESVMSAVGLFAAAGFRLLPILNRVQGASLSAIGYVPLAREAILGSANFPENHPVVHDGFECDGIAISDVSFSYPGHKERILKNINLSLDFGYQYAIVGPSGSGKTTLSDLILGILKPTSGVINYSQVFSNRKFGYIPQDVHIMHSGLFENVALDINPSMQNLDRFKYALEKSNLNSFNIDPKINELANLRSYALSGGQKQRIGLARAIFAESNLLILDEATSALDAVTESKIVETVDSFRGEKLVIIIAHRLSTIRNADKVIYLSEGEIKGIGKFEELYNTLPEFSDQVKLGQLGIIED
jgi:ABC-type multidrug transport system fused ATPase/permease subunit